MNNDMVSCFVRFDVVWSFIWFLFGQTWGSRACLFDLFVCIVQLCDLVCDVVNEGIVVLIAFCLLWPSFESAEMCRGLYSFIIY